MSAPFPSRYELQMAGCSLLVAQLLWALTGIAVFSAGWDSETGGISAYDIDTEEQVIDVHESLSSSTTRSLVQMYAAVYWISFPLLLVAIYGINKLYVSIFIGTKMEMWVYVAEKAYLLALVVTNIIGPALGYNVFCKRVPDDYYCISVYFTQTGHRVV